MFHFFIFKGRIVRASGRVRGHLVSHTPKSRVENWLMRISHWPNGLRAWVAYQNAGGGARLDPRGLTDWKESNTRSSLFISFLPSVLTYYYVRCSPNKDEWTIRQKVSDGHEHYLNKNDKSPDLPKRCIFTFGFQDAWYKRSISSSSTTSWETPNVSSVVVVIVFRIKFPKTLLKDIVAFKCFRFSLLDVPMPAVSPRLRSSSSSDKQWL